MNLADASSLLWRLQLRGVDVGERWSALAQRWRAQGAWGTSAFFDMHAAMVFAAAGDGAAVDALRAAAGAAATASPSGDALWRRLMLPVIDGFAALLDGQPARCAELLLPLLPVTQPMGGSHAQRQVLLLTALEATRRSGNRGLAEALAAEQAVHRIDVPAPRRTSMSTLERNARSLATA